MKKLLILTALLATSCVQAPPPPPPMDCPCCKSMQADKPCCCKGKHGKFCPMHQMQHNQTMEH